MLFSLDVIRARKGDCLMLHFGSEEPHHIMIDGGPRSVYGPHLKKRIQQIKENREIDQDEPLTVDLLMVSHVDDDHIRGILDMTREMIDDGSQIVEVLSLWHNSFNNIIGSKPDELLAAFAGNFGQASLGGELPNDITLDADDEELDEETIVWNLKALASIAQGAQLRQDADKLGFELNPEFDGGLILANEDTEPMAIGEDGDFLKFTVVGPMLPELNKLHNDHQKWLKKLKDEGKKPADVLSEYLDKSVANLSSIVVLAEAHDKSMLLTGDARGDKVLEGLELVGLLEKNGKMHVNVLKVPHHGSARNLDNDFFERITADHYVLSGNGEHGNPERESLEMLLNARPDVDYEVHLTYPIDVIDKAREEDWKKEQAKEKKKKLKNPEKEVRPDWSVEEHSLASFLEENKKFAKQVRIVADGKPHLIDLLDKVKF
jgi:hypothetical protein